MKIVKITKESANGDTRTFEMQWMNPEDDEAFNHFPGQFAELSVLGSGEAPISITSSPTQPNLQFCIKKMGVVTTAIHYMKEGDVFGVRGPYGNWFPFEEMKGKNIFFIAGGIGLAPLRSLINFMLHESNRADYKDICIIYGARSPGDLLFKYELEDWRHRPDVEYIETIDRAAPGWEGNVGFVPAIMNERAPSPENSVAVTCGPPIMIKFVLQGLTDLGFKPGQLVTTLEMRMKCGIGKCGRCNIGNKYVCIDGPVFNYEQLLKMPREY